jgi:hypothetical protein
MAYGLRYTLTQILRNGSTLVVNIYEKDPSVATVKTYQPTSILLQPNSNNEDPLGGIISSELNVSFLISTQDDYDNFPDLLNADDRKYYVELVNVVGASTNIKWKGFLFNDYINLPFTTGNQEVNFVCVDALSYLKYNTYSALEGNTNGITNLLSVLNTALYSIGYDSYTYLYSCCSYFAEGMMDRATSTDNEPFVQTYQFRRDFVGLDYFTIVDNIVKSFGCRLFQYQGNWWIMSINEMAGTTNYYTKYLLDTVVYLTESGTLTAGISIDPYSEGNVHFINNSQTKITKKGYSRLKVTTPYSYAKNYINDGDFKQYINSTTAPVGFTAGLAGTGSLTVYQYPDDEFNDVRIQQSGTGVATFKTTGEIGALGYLPKMGNSNATLSFTYTLYSTLGFGVTGLCYLLVRLFVGSNAYILDSNGNWSNDINTYILLPPSNPPIGGVTDRRPTQSYSLDIPLGKNTLNNVDVAIGYISIGFVVSSASSLFRFNNLSLTQSNAQYNVLEVERKLGTNEALLKEIEIPYGANYPDLTVPNTIGSLFNNSLVKLQNWYRYGKAGTYSNLTQLICRQYSNIFNKNLATVEGDLGISESSNSTIYLNKKYHVADSTNPVLTANNLSYNDKTFMANRLTVDSYGDRTTSLQLLEITNTDNASVETIKYLGS